jgi:hypothetical protein
MHITRWGKRRDRAWQKVQPQLEVADIFLTRDTSSLLSGTIRKVSNSYWNHSGLILFTSKNKYFFKNILIVSAEDHGIEVHRIQKFTKRFDFVDIGIKRVPGLSEELRKQVARYMFNNLDIPYDYTRVLGLLIKFIQSRITKSEAHLRQLLTNKDAFICSSFIQKAFYQSVPQEMKERVIFKEGGKESEFEEVTPADIAHSKACKWVYNAHD